MAPSDYGLLLWGSLALHKARDIRSWWIRCLVPFRVFKGKRVDTSGQNSWHKQRWSSTLHPTFLSYPRNEPRLGKCSIRRKHSSSTLAIYPKVFILSGKSSLGFVLHGVGLSLWNSTLNAVPSDEHPDTCTCDL